MTYKEENIVNIAMRAAELLMDGKIARDDVTGHAGLTDVIISLAEEFENQNAGVDFDAEGRDYWLDIDAFAEEQLLQRYGIDQELSEQTLDIKIVIDRGVVHAALKNQSLAVNVEIVDVDPDYEDYEALDAYRSQLYKDPSYSDCPFTVVRFSEDELSEEQVISPEVEPVLVVPVCGNTKGAEIFSGTWDECEQFCKENSWTYWDENNFRWDLTLEDPREDLLPQGYYNAVDYYCDLVGADIENGFVRQHGDKLVCCHQNYLCFEDFVAWVHCEAALGPLSLMEYQRIEREFDVTSMDEIANSPQLEEMKIMLKVYREPTALAPAHTSLDSMIAGAKEKCSNSPLTLPGKEKDQQR